MFAGVPSAQNNSHLGMYQNNEGNVEMENNGEDLLMMNIPREGNAD